MSHRVPEVLVTVIFIGVLLSAGSVQLGIDLWRDEKPRVLELFTRPPTASHLRAYEQDLEDSNWLAERLRPWTQYAQFILLEDLGEKAFLGRDGWFFYKPAVDYLILRQGVDAASGDPVEAILDFRDQLAARGIQLVVLPVPNKGSVYPEMLASGALRLQGSVCERTQSLMRRLEAAGVEVVDLFRRYATEKSASTTRGGSALYLAQDSHWSPAGLEVAARAVAQRVEERGWIQPGSTPYSTRPAPIERLGDIVRMLKVPQIETLLEAERVRCVQVIHPDTGQPYQDQPGSEILVLGDSFLRVFQQDEPGSAGFIAHLAKELGQPVSSIVNDGGASTLVRQELYRRPGLLEKKKVVVWEFVERDIRFGTEGWQPIPLPPEERSEARGTEDTRRIQRNAPGG